MVMVMGGSGRVDMAGRARAAVVVILWCWCGEVPGLLAQDGAPAAPAVTPAPQSLAPTSATGSYSYDPSGRRDPFKPVGLEVQEPGAARLDLPPLQRVGLTELSLIGIIWGGFGYSAMVQTPDGKGYTIKRGTRIGPNNGVVSAITENALIVQEQYSDVYGKKQVREYVKHLHPKEGSE
jgi:type IV pilus assembly protein PilP